MLDKLTTSSSIRKDVSPKTAVMRRVSCRLVPKADTSRTMPEARSTYLPSSHPALVASCSAGIELTRPCIGIGPSSSPSGSSGPGTGLPIAVNPHVYTSPAWKLRANPVGEDSSANAGLTARGGVSDASGIPRNDAPATSKHRSGSSVNDKPSAMENSICSVPRPLPEIRGAINVCTAR